METRVSIRCTQCPPGKRHHGELGFPMGVPALLLWKCPRGHGWGIRALTREERRARPKEAPAFVATPWEIE